MTCHHVAFPDGSAAILKLGPPTLRIEVDGRIYPFEDHGYCGPTPLDKRGEPKDLGPRHRFWHAVTCWAAQGRELDASGLAQWREPADPLAGCVRIGRDWYPKELAARLFPGIPADEVRE